MKSLTLSQDQLVKLAVALDAMPHGYAKRIVAILMEAATDVEKLETPAKAA